MAVEFNTWLADWWTSRVLGKIGNGSEEKGFLATEALRRGQVCVSSGYPSVLMDKQDCEGHRKRTNDGKAISL